MTIAANIPNNDGEAFFCLLACAMVNAPSFLWQLKFPRVFNSDVDTVIGASVLADLTGTCKLSQQPKRLLNSL